MRKATVALALLLAAGCGKKDDAPSAAPTPAVPAAGTAAAPARPAAQPVPQRTDDRLKPGVWLSVNGRGAAEIFRGWPMTVTATVLGPKGPPFTFSIDDVALEIRDGAGKKVEWPMKRLSTENTLTAQESRGATLAWVAGDTSSLAEGTYRLTATLKGGASDSIPVKIAAATTPPTPEQDRERFALEVRAALQAGQHQVALDRAASRLTAHPTERLAHVLKGDALAALGKPADAAAAYREAIRLFGVQNPKAKEPPFELLRRLQSVSSGR